MLGKTGLGLVFQGVGLSVQDMLFKASFRVWDSELTGVFRICCLVPGRC